MITVDKAKSLIKNFGSNEPIFKILSPSEVKLIYNLTILHSFKIHRYIKSYGKKIHKKSQLFLN